MQRSRNGREDALMGKVYKDKKSKGCALCKPHKHGWAPKKKTKVAALGRDMEKEAKEAHEAHRGYTMYYIHQ